MKVDICDWGHAFPEDTSQVSYIRKWLKCQQSPPRLLCLLYPWRTCGHMGCSLWWADRPRNVSGLVYWWFCTKCRRPPKVDYSPALGHPWRIVAKGNPPRGQNLTQCSRFFTLPGRIGQTSDYISTHGLWPMVFKGLGRKMIGKLIRKFWEEVCGWTAPNWQRTLRYLDLMWILT